MGDFSSYYLYEKYEIIGDELVPLGIFSMDADGTQDVVVKEECDKECGCPEPIYRWIQTEDVICIEVLTRTISGDPYCSGVDKYEDVYSQVSYDEGITWTTTATTPTLIQAKSTDCGFSARTVSTATTCVGVDKHYLDEYQESSDSGATWTTISSSTGTLIEANSEDCGYRTRTLSGTPYCDGDDLVVETSAQTSSDSGSTWTTVSTAITMVESGSAQCHQTVNVTGVTLNKNSMTLNSGSSETLVATVSPSNADDKSVTWSSNNTSVATVNSSGLVSAVTSGSATITVTTTDGGYTAQCSVSVSANTHDYSQDYLTFRALEDGTFTLSARADTYSYSTDSGSTWSEFSNTATTPTITNGNTVLWKSHGRTIQTNDGLGTFSSTGRFSAEGNVTSILTTTPVTGQTANNVMIDNAFKGMFSGCTGLTSAQNLVLPATTLKSNCYTYMFSGCTSLTTAPQLPATTLDGYCYTYMFSGCTSLTTAPQLPATTLDGYCYMAMFKGCTSLTTAPSLPATTLDGYCYSSMFYGCTSLTTAPTLPATTLTTNCYYAMFQGCTSLTTPPILSATTLDGYCYMAMFKGCTSLTTAPELPATTLVDSCYYGMFSGCTSLVTAPELPATTLANYCYNHMFYGCTNLNSITCLATDISASQCTSSWVQNVAASGTFTKAASMNDWTSGNSGIPSGWTVQDYTS